MSDIDVASAIDQSIAFLGDYVDETRAEGYVVGISGGLDSAVAATLAVEAIGADSVTGLILPDTPNSPENMADARALATDLEIEHHEIPITSIVTEIRESLPDEVDQRVVGNVRARVRMVVQYAEANANDLLVLGTSNKSEVLLGYFTKYGDGAVDVRPLAELYKTEVRAVARELGLDEPFLEKAPTAELWAGQTDETELGASYETIDTFLIETVEKNESIDAAAARAGISLAEGERILRKLDRSAHKRSSPPSPQLRS